MTTNLNDIKERADKHQSLCYRFGVQFYNDLTRNISRVVREMENEGAKKTGRSKKHSIQKKGKGGRHERAK